jgi:hypothetical protein
MWNTDITDFEGTDGDLPTGRAGRTARFLGEIVAAASILPLGEFQLSGIRCRRRPNHRRCSGALRIGREACSDEIHWSCSVCDDRGMITNWQRTRWDLSAEVQRRHIVSLSAERARRAGRVVAPLEKVQVYELDVELVTAPWPLRERVVRRFRLGGENTLRRLHEAIQAAFERPDPLPYEFMFGAPYEPDVRRFPEPAEAEQAEAESSRLDALGLRPGQTFGYLVDIQEVRVHRVTVISAREVVGHSVPPRLVERVGVAPAERELLGQDWDGLWSDLDEVGPMSCLYGVYSAEQGPTAEEWLKLGGLERQVLIMEAHATLPTGHPELESLPLHAVVHDLAETHLAEIGEHAARSLLGGHPQRRSGRHAVIHDIGTRLAQQQLGQSPRRRAKTCAGHLEVGGRRDLEQ